MQYPQLLRAYEVRQLQSSRYRVERLLMIIKRRIDDLVCANYYTSSLDMTVTLETADVTRLTTSLTDLGYFVSLDPQGEHDAMCYNLHVRWAGAGVVGYVEES